MLREQSDEPGYQKLANVPHKFRDTKTAQTDMIIVPTVSSERREYLPVGICRNEPLPFCRNGKLKSAKCLI